MLSHNSGAQSPSDEQATFNAAIAETSPQARINALNSFLHSFPDAGKRASAEELLLETYLEVLPPPTMSIHVLVSAKLAVTPAGLDRWIEEARLADLLANAGDHGADLVDAGTWAEDAVQSMTEPAYRQQIVRMQIRYRLPALTPKQLRTQFSLDRSACLAALANVKLRQNRTEEAALLVAEALHLNASSAEGHRLEGELALAQGRKQAALSELIEANALGPLPIPWRSREETLFAELNGGDTAALEQRIDNAYRTLHAPLFRLPKRQVAAEGHPALLELFTGSDCAPCTGPDLALDSLLGTYDRADFIALEFDEHIPRPDPLATPATVVRADAYGVGSTPAAFLDGEPVELLGSSRTDVANIVVGLADRIEDAASLPSGVRLILTGYWDGAGVIRSTVALAQTPLTNLSASANTGNASLRALQKAVIHVALVEDDVRYPGKNGVRFHRMVVRALQQEPAAAFMTGPARAPVISFPLEDLQREQIAYLSKYEMENIRFGRFHFPEKDIPVREDHLALIAWVQDPATRRVLQSTFFAVPTR